MILSQIWTLHCVMRWDLQVDSFVSTSLCITQSIVNVIRYNTVMRAWSSVSQLVGRWLVLNGSWSVWSNFPCFKIHFTTKYLFIYVGKMWVPKPDGLRTTGLKVWVFDSEPKQRVQYLQPTCYWYDTSCLSPNRSSIRTCIWMHALDNSVCCKTIVSGVLYLLVCSWPAWHRHPVARIRRPWSPSTVGPDGPPCPYLSPCANVASHPTSPSHSPSPVRSFQLLAVH